MEMSVVLFDRLYMSCALFFFKFFRYILIENGMKGFTSLCHIFARFKVLSEARIDPTMSEYLHCLCESLNEPLHLRCCS